MTGVSKRLKDFLAEKKVEFETIHHRRDVTAMETAQDTHTPGQEFAKTVLVRLDDDYAMAVLPAHHKVDFEKMARAAGAARAELAAEADIGRLCPDCEIGAEPPFGNLYDLPVYVAPAIEKDEHITFNAGSHEEAVRMPYDVYAKLVHPKVADFSRSK